MPDQPSKYSMEYGVISISIALLAASAVILENAEKYSDALRMTLSLSVVLLGLSFLTALWYRYHWPKRTTMLNVELQKVAQQQNAAFKELFDLTITPIVDHELRPYMQQNPVQNVDDFRERVTEAANRRIWPIVQRYNESFSKDFDRVRERFLSEPLPEPWPRLQYFLDMVSLKTRFIFFVGGFVLFVASLVLRLL